MRCVASIMGILMLAGCAATPGSHEGMHDAGLTLTPGWHRIGRAAIDAARSPATWAPVATAGLLQIGHADHDVADWASDHTPVFGSQDTAQTASDLMVGSAIGLYAVTTLAQPTDAGDKLNDQAQRLGVGIGAIGVTEGVVQGLKHTVNRNRPDDSDHDSFPSGHAGLTGVADTMTRHNVETLPIGQPARWALDGLATGLDIGTGYARVAANKHYPSDVLVGFAIGHFIGVFADKAFVGSGAQGFVPTVAVSRQGASLSFQHAF